MFMPPFLYKVLFFGPSILIWALGAPTWAIVFAACTGLQLWVAELRAIGDARHLDNRISGPGTGRNG